MTLTFPQLAMAGTRIGILRRWDSKTVINSAARNNTASSALALGSPLSLLSCRVLVEERMIMSTLFPTP
ncbi:hypothetical protein LSTR_LSTR013445 [Laodelphax striatellus]|uniref:Uncharacterized protein n=1 Tax=Laodelphax striatellus TaxID=195883 RepID=A0A482WLE7_LAOST|nr:hypothetical protein LSTR_LSTR013445 [Laodelphax striatellus]